MKIRAMPRVTFNEERGTCDIYATPYLILFDYWAFRVGRESLLYTYTK
jgi:hypothetical protein